MKGSKAFPARLERMQSNLGWVIARIPFDVAEAWETRGQLRVKGEINGFGFRTSLFPTGQGTHYLLVNKAMQKGARAAPGDTARFRLEPDFEDRPVAMPPELERALEQIKSLRRFFDQWTPSRRRDFCRLVLQVKSPEARRRRAEQVAEHLLATMEAERDLPPILKAALARDGAAWRGWQTMPLSHRRSHLFAVFYYKSPEAQARRVAKVIEACRKRAGVE